MRNRPKPQTIYRHFKGNLYQIQCIAYHSETGEEMVVYQALYGDYKYYVRPLSMFMEKVDKVKYPNARQEYRFEEFNSSQAKEHETCLTSKEDLVSESSSSLKESISSENQVVSEPSFDDALDDDVIEFLDADGYERRLEILGKIKYKITNDMIDIMSTVVDIDIPDGDVARRYEDFKEALMMRKHYEGRRLR